MGDEVDAAKACEGSNIQLGEEVQLLVRREGGVSRQNWTDRRGLVRQGRAVEAGDVAWLCQGSTASASQAGHRDVVALVFGPVSFGVGDSGALDGEGAARKGAARNAGVKQGRRVGDVDGGGASADVV